MPSGRTNSVATAEAGFPADLLVTLDRSAGRGLRGQLEGQLRAAIRDGRLPVGTALPPSRVLATELGVARGVVVDAYGQLVAEGYLEARRGSGTRVGAAQPHDAAAHGARDRRRPARPSPPRGPPPPARLPPPPGPGPPPPPDRALPAPPP